MIRALFAGYLTWLNSIDEAELLERCVDGTASTAWACEVLSSITKRLDKIDELRAPRFTTRGVA